MLCGYTQHSAASEVPESALTSSWKLADGLYVSLFSIANEELLRSCVTLAPTHTRINPDGHRMNIYSRENLSHIPEGLFCVEKKITWPHCKPFIFPFFVMGRRPALVRSDSNLSIFFCCVTRFKHNKKTRILLFIRCPFWICNAVFRTIRGYTTYLWTLLFCFVWFCCGFAQPFKINIGLTP